MDTIYNVDLGMSNCHPDCSIELFGKTGEVLENNGLLGIRHVTKIGELKEGYDSKCKTFRKAFFDVHYNANITESASEILSHQQVRGMGKSIFEIMEKADPSSVIPLWKTYSSFPRIPSMEIVTPCGRQSVHYHTEDDIDRGIIQLWKPQNEKNWYSFDVFKNFLFCNLLKESDMYFKLADPEYKTSFRERRQGRKQQQLFNKAGELYKKIMVNPDKVKKIPRFIKKLSTFS